MDVRTVDRVEEAQLLETIGRWLERKVRPIVKEYDHADRYPTEIVEQMKALRIIIVKQWINRTRWPESVAR